MDENELQDLQQRLSLAAIDLRQRIDIVLGVEVRRQDVPPVLEVIVKEEHPIVLRIDGSQNHARAHVHIDIGKVRRMASYAIDTGERLAPKKADRSVEQFDDVVAEWIANNRVLLLQVWDAVRGGWPPNAAVKQLKDSPFA